MRVWVPYIARGEDKVLHKTFLLGRFVLELVAAEKVFI